MVYLCGSGTALSCSCLPVCLPTISSACLCSFLSIKLFACHSMCFSTHLVCLSTCTPVYLSTCMLICLSVCMPVCLTPGLITLQTIPNKHSPAWPSKVSISINDLLAKVTTYGPAGTRYLIATGVDYEPFLASGTLSANSIMVLYGSYMCKITLVNNLVVL